jgi:hypothetical protein
VSYIVPTGYTMLTKQEQSMVAPALLPFSYTLGTLYVLANVLGRDVSTWRRIKPDGNPDLDGILDILYSGLYDLDDPLNSPSRNTIARLITPVSAPYVNSMIDRVMDKSTPALTDEQKRKMEGDDPNGQSP